MSNDEHKTPRVKNSPPEPVESPAEQSVEWYDGTVSTKPSRNNAPSVHLFARQEVEPGKWYTDYSTKLGAGWGDIRINVVLSREELETLLRETKGDQIRIGLVQNIFRGSVDERKG